MVNRKVKDLLDRKAAQYNHIDFIAADPVSIPHRFSKKEDIEISGFFAAIFAWGNRNTIIRKANSLFNLMDDAPHDFILQCRDTDLKRFSGFCHRTFNTTDLLYFIRFLKQHYRKEVSLETSFFPAGEATSVEEGLNYFRKYFFSLQQAPLRTRKHISAPQLNSSCKRLNMYLRWMLRHDEHGVDFGLWKSIAPSELICPLDVHVVRVANHLGLLQRKSVDWTAALQLTDVLKTFDPADPVKYDFALFGMGVNREF